MCLSTVYRLNETDQPELICKEVAAILNDIEHNKLTFTDIMGISTVVQGAIAKVDLMDNFVYIK